MNTQAVIYARVSTEEQVKGYSLRTQVEACRKYAVDHNYEVVAEFSEDYTGATMDRPELNRLRDFLSQAKVDRVIVYELDRLARKSAYQVLIEEEFGRAGALLECATTQYEDSEEGRLQKQIRGVIAEYEKAKFLERGRRGKRGKAQAGFVITGARPPFGYKVRSEPHKAWLDVDESEAAIVRMVYDWYLKGDEKGSPMSANSIAVRLTKLGLPTRGDRESHVIKRHGRGVWQRATVINILTNQTYTGTWHYGKTRMVEDGRHRTSKSKRGLGKQVPRAREEWIPVTVPTIIDSETFSQAQKRKHNLKGLLAGHAVHKYLMKSRLKCSKCGYALRGQMVRGKYQYYLCNARKQIVSLCDMPAVKGDRVDEITWNWVRAMLENPENLRDGFAGVQAEIDHGNRNVQARLTAIDGQLSEKQGQLSKLIDLYLANEFPRDLLAGRKSQLEGEIAALRSERDSLASRARTAIDADAQFHYFQGFCAKIRKGIEKADFNAKRQILELLDVRGKIAVESGDKVLHLECLIDPLDQQQVLPIQTSHSSSTGAIAMTP